VRVLNLSLAAKCTAELAREKTEVSLLRELATEQLAEAKAGLEAATHKWAAAHRVFRMHVRHHHESHEDLLTAALDTQEK
jgi:hypothetical protein